MISYQPMVRPFGRCERRAGRLLQHFFNYQFPQSLQNKAVLALYPFGIIFDAY